MVKLAGFLIFFNTVCGTGKQENNWSNSLSPSFVAAANTANSKHTCDSTYILHLSKI